MAAKTAADGFAARCPSAAITCFLPVLIVPLALKEMGVCGLYWCGKNVLLNEGCMLGWAPTH